MKDIFILQFKMLFLVSIFCIQTPTAYASKVLHESLKKYSEIPVQISYKLKEHVLRAAVKVEDPITKSYGSGSYIVIDNHFLVLTAAHVVDSVDILHVKNGYETVIGTVIYRNVESDIAFLLVPEMRSRKAMEYKKITKSDMVGEPVIYAGYPNSHDLLLFFGRVAGKAGESLIVHSYAWMGSSGSVVVNMKGKIVGVLTAVDVGMFEKRPQIIEDAVWVSPIEKVNDAKIRSILNEI